MKSFITQSGVKLILVERGDFKNKSTVNSVSDEIGNNKILFEEYISDNTYQEKILPISLTNEQFSEIQKSLLIIALEEQTNNSENVKRKKEVSTSLCI